MSEWQPIETAPKDETVIVYREDNEIILTCFFNPYQNLWEQEVGTDTYQKTFFTHWMPLPPPPERIER